MYWHTTYGEINLVEQVYYRKGVGIRIRPFSESAHVHCRGYSLPLQRAISDFGGEEAFGQVEQKLREHYGIGAPTSSVRVITERHATKIREWQENNPKKKARKISLAIVETDGSMVPIVQQKRVDGEGKIDRRKNKEYVYKEARLSLARGAGFITPVFAATMDGVNNVGQQLEECVEKIGGHAKTKVHAVGDGAPWIAIQVEERFGANGKFLLDFYHVCEYLSKAAEVCAQGSPRAWLELQKTRLKTGRLEETLRELFAYRESSEIEDEKAPVRGCYRYLTNRLTQLHYKETLEQDLPIGSGEVESAHRYVIQERLKIAGAWWDIEHAKDMLALRVCSANQEWVDYWSSRECSSNCVSIIIAVPNLSGRQNKFAAEK